MYQLLSFAERNGWVSVGAVHVETPPPQSRPLVLIGAAMAGPADTQATTVVRMPHALIESERRLIRNCFMFDTHLPWMSVPSPDASA